MTLYNMLTPRFMAEVNRLYGLPGDALDALTETAMAAARYDSLVEAIGRRLSLLAQVTRETVPSDPELRAGAGELIGDRHGLIEALPLFFSGPMLEARNAANGYPADMAAANCADVRVWMNDYRLRYGCWGLVSGAIGWLSQHFTGQMFALGRLQFEMISMPREAEAVSARDGRRVALAIGDPVLGVHIPAGPGMTPEACGDSMRRARAFFPRFFPGYHPKAFHCGSWLLYPPLMKILPPQSNIVRFQRPFSIYDVLDETDAMWDRIFLLDGTPDAQTIARLPRDTSLRRALLDHVAAGGTLGGGRGVVLWEDAEAWEEMA